MTLEDENLDYDTICRLNEVHNLKKNPYDNSVENHENQTLYIMHQILESWIQVAKKLINCITERVNSKNFEHL